MSTLPEHLHPAFNWTDSAGELEELRVLTGDRLAKYCLESAINAREHDEDVSASDLLELSGWLKMEHVRRMTPGEAWDAFVGGQSTSEFVANCHGEPIEEACSQYLQEMRKAASDWDLDAASEAHVARLLASRIRETGAAWDQRPFEIVMRDQQINPALDLRHVGLDLVDDRDDPRYAVLVCGHIVGRYDSLSEAAEEADRLNADECDDIVGDGAASVWDTWTE